MAFVLAWTPEADNQFQQLQTVAEVSLKKRQKDKKQKATKAEGLFKQVVKSIRLLSVDPRHPGLCTHEYSSIPNPYDPKKKVFEAYAQNNTPGAYRVFWCYGPASTDITIISITPHP